MLAQIRSTIGAPLPGTSRIDSSGARVGAAARFGSTPAMPRAMTVTGMMPKRSQAALDDRFRQATGFRNQANLVDYLRGHSMADAQNALANQTARSDSTLAMGNYLLGRERENLQNRGAGMS